MVSDPRELLLPRPSPVGLATVDRYLPGARRRLIGPWCFLDSFGRRAGPDSGVGPHPHIGIQTATWLFSGASTHRDSLGSEATVTPGSLSLMTAAAGVAHAEELPEPTAAAPVGTQLWIALPDRDRGRPPAFALHESAAGTPDGGLALQVFAGELHGLAAPATFFSPIVGAELRLAPAASARLSLEVAFEHGLLLLEGDLSVDGSDLDIGPLTYLAPGAHTLEVASASGARALLIGGEPFEEELLMWWNFVARDEEEILVAREDWEAGRRFGPVEGSALGRIDAPPLPALHLRARSRLR